MSSLDRRPLSVVKSDQDALTTAIALHAVSDPRILDACHNEGRMWKGTRFQPHRMDINPDLYDNGFVDTVADFRALPFDSESFDVIAFDPPHVANAGTTGIVGSSEMWGSRFGNASELVHGNGNEISHLFEPFLLEAQRVLTKNTGIVIAKIADQVTSGTYHFQHVDFINTCEKVGFRPCDLYLTLAWSRGGLNDPKWAHIRHARQVHCYWIVARNGKSCTSPDAPTLDKSRTLPLF